MRSKVLWFLLAASLALNVFFVAGVIWPRLMGHPQPPHGHDAVAQAAADFALDDRQVAALEDLRRRLAEQRESRRGERASFQALSIDALRRPYFVRGDLSQITEQRRAQGGYMILDMTEDQLGRANASNTITNITNVV